MNLYFRLLLFAFIPLLVNAQESLITNIPGRKTFSLDGKWNYIIDPYETGFYNYRLTERNETDRDAYWNTDVPQNKTDRKEHGYIKKYSLNVPGDWNSQEKRFEYYEGTVWYKRSFNYQKAASPSNLYLYFGAVNYRTDVYLNGHKLGSHKGGFTPFNFLIPDSILKALGNFLVVKVDNKRYPDEVPTVNTDWWNYGGITRSVSLVEVPKVFIKDYFFMADHSDNYSKPTHSNKIKYHIQLSNNENKNIKIEVPELHFSKNVIASAGVADGDFSLDGVELWSPQKPKLYKVVVSTSDEKITEKIGFRTIEVKGKNILLNGKQIFLRGISIHEEIASEGRRAYSKNDALKLLLWAKELHCNMVRLAHYPHNENMSRMADSLGILVWSEIPVYWTIEFTNPLVFEKAFNQLKEMISRDHNRASIIIWSVGNETPVSEARTKFMKGLVAEGKVMDPSRLFSAALEVNYNSGRHLNVIDDPLGEFTDLVSFNEYLGWYGGSPDQCRTTNWATKYDKPLFISETGAGALGGFHKDSATMWTEEYQTWYYREQIKMLRRMPDNFVGISPWILSDFRSPRRNNPIYQDGWNRKGLIDQHGNKKKAFYLLRDYYMSVEKQ